MVREVIHAENCLGSWAPKRGRFPQPRGEGALPSHLPVGCCAVRTPGSPRQQEVDLAQQRLYIGSGFWAPNAWMMDAAVERGTRFDVRNLV